MFRKTVFGIVLALSCYAMAQPSVAQAKAWGLAYNSAAEVRGSGGFVVSENETHYFIMTAGHVVVDDKKEVYKDRDLWVRFYSAGTISIPAYPTLIWHIYDTGPDKGYYNDLALLKLDKEWFVRTKTPKPQIIHLLDRKIKPKTATPFITFGSPGPWLSAYSGLVRSVHPNHIMIYPVPKRGRSGSAVVDYEGNVLGVVLRTDGLCVSSTHIYELLDAAKIKNT